MNSPRRLFVLALLLSSPVPGVVAHQLEEVQVTGRRINLIGEAVSASQGMVGQQEIQVRPLLRTGEVLEMVPGMVVSQHSGTGKANQYFLRGFNLDHGTDFATWVDGMPVNMRTHGHGQGYTDLNFIIPEAVASMEYRKGSHYSERGDFSSVGSADITTASGFDRNLLEATLGENNYLRLLAMGGLSSATGDFTYALEAGRYDGPWTDIDEDVDKLNGLLKYGFDMGQGRLTLTAMGYDNSWNSADQIPKRAVQAGIIDELGSLDTTVGGESSRYSLSANWSSEVWQVDAYLIDYDLELFSNFTYFLDDPLAGDQFQQVDKRRIYGGQARYRFGDLTEGAPGLNRLGVELRYDEIDEVGLYRAENGQRGGVVRSDEVDELSIGVFIENEWRWNHHLRSVVGARYDFFDFDVASRVQRNVNGIDLSANGGTRDEGLLSLNANLIYSVDERWEIYGSAGQGFHSNDARGTTITTDPLSGAPAQRVDPLVESLGGEIGVRAFWRDRLNASLALWYLELDSELLFVGDAGGTEATRASERRGLEFSAYYYFAQDWTFDLEYAWTDARYSDRSPEGRHIPGSLEQVVQSGISYNSDPGWFGSLRLRYFGPRPLLEDASVESDSSTLLNLRVGRRWEQLRLWVDVLNLLDSDDHDVDYFYASRLPGEPPEGVEDLHYHVLEPRTVRLSLSWQY